MTVIYRTSGAWGGGQGSDLSATQIDGNFYTLALAIAAKAATGAGVATMTVVGNNQLQTQLTDGTFLPPVTLPTATFTFRGQWLPDTVYAANDIISDDGSVYLVLIAHTSEGTFDPGANNGSGSDFYGLLLSLPDDVIPHGGLAGEVLTKASNTDLDTEWAFPTLAGLHDVIQSPAPVNGDLIIFNGSKFIYTAESALSIAASQITGLTLESLFDVGIISPESSGDLLMFNGSTWHNQPQSELSIAGTQITGTISFEQLPNPTAVTIGGVESFAAVSHQFLTQIGTDGSVTAAQPAFSDLVPGPADLLAQTVTQSGGSLAINRSLGEVVQVTLSANITSISVSNWPASGTLGKITLLATNGGAFTLGGWPSGTIWPAGSPPVLTSGSGKKDVFILMSPDGGTTIYGSVAGQNYS